MLHAILGRDRNRAWYSRDRTAPGPADGAACQDTFAVANAALQRTDRAVPRRTSGREEPKQTEEAVEETVGAHDLGRHARRLQALTVGLALIAKRVVLGGHHDRGRQARTDPARGSGDMRQSAKSSRRVRA